MFHICKRGVYYVPTTFANASEITKILFDMWNSKSVLRETIQLMKFNSRDVEGSEGLRDDRHRAQNFVLSGVTRRIIPCNFPPLDVYFVPVNYALLN